MSSALTPIEVFCSYAHKDEPLLQALEVHLSGLKRQGLIATWHDRQIVAGTDKALQVMDVQILHIVPVQVSPAAKARLTVPSVRPSR